MITSQGKKGFLFFCYLFVLLSFGCTDTSSGSTTQNAGQEVNTPAKSNTAKKALPAPRNLKMIEKSTNYQILKINGQPVKDTEQPLSISGNRLIIEGWAVDIHQKALAGGVYLVIDKAHFPGQYGFARPLIAEALGNKKYTKSGFKLDLAIGRLAKGKHTINVKVLSRKNNNMYYQMRPNAAIDIQID